MIVTVGVRTCVFVRESWCLCWRHQANKQQLGACISMSVLLKLNPAQWEMCSGLQRDEFLCESVSHNRTPSSCCCHARETWDLQKQLQHLYFNYSVLSWTACGRSFQKKREWEAHVESGGSLWGDWLRKLRSINKQAIFNILCCLQKKCTQVWSLSKWAVALKSHLWNMRLASMFLPRVSVLRNSDFHNRRDGFARYLGDFAVWLLWAERLAMVDFRGCCVLCWGLARSLAFRWPRSPRIQPDLYKATCACACTPHTHMGRISNMPVIL